MTELAQPLRAAGVHTLLVRFTDLHGVAKGKLVPLAQAEHLEHARHVSAWELDRYAATF
jgi:glutamine synthetase